MFDAQCDVAALVYEAHQPPDGVLLDFVAALKARELRPVGLVQFGHHNAGAAELAAMMVHSGERVDLFQEVATYTQGRRLDLDKLAAAHSAMMTAIDQGADLLVVNRFGRQEQQGRGLARLIEYALAADVPVVVPVPAFRFDDWIAYIEGMCVKLPCDGAALETWWNGLAQRDRTRHVQHNACEVLK
ncbi:DUF2478 domain-containing protein [Nitrobacteraceae bacterium UC4446_H13]